MTPEDVVARFVALILEHPERSADELVGALVDAGVPFAMAERAYQMTQIAWGRVILDGLGIGFPSDYVYVNGAGDVVEEGSIAANPFYAAAMAASKAHTRAKGFAALAASSADFQSANAALNDGSSPNNLVMATPHIFVEPSTPAGLAKVSARIAASRAASPDAARSKPWWRVW